MEVVIGLGANLGEPLVAFRDAISELSGTLEPLAVSPVYRSAAIGPEQPDFLNAALLARCRLEPETLLQDLLETERKLGRRRVVRWGPRLIDLDVLWIAGRHIDSPHLSVPHPRLRERAFALYPLLDVVPDARDPRDGAAYSELRDALRGQRIERLEEVRIELFVRG